MHRIKLNSFVCREKLSEVHDELQKKEAALAELQPDVSQNRKWVFFVCFIFLSVDLCCFFGSGLHSLWTVRY